MPYRLINGARLFYQGYGQDTPDRVPILLIHGSTVTGQVDWGMLAPLLAARQKVIVPDCRGHGKSTNPSLTYSFQELADDAISLMQSLGYAKFHVMGHSNGGNVALVALIKYPQYIQCAVLQAANAYVSPDLVEIEPDKFNPERVARENPAWMHEMINLHAKTHGKEYWRDLLKMTVQEIISQPNFTAQDLAKVKAPVLVIQGENDSVNAASQHAQFIATSIPFAELWTPTGIGHNVHKEIPITWLEKINEFLDQRGDDHNEALYQLKKKQYPDPRQVIFEVKAKRTSKNGSIQLFGRVLSAEQRQAAIQSIASLSTSQPYLQAKDHQVQVLLTENTPSALVTRAVTDIRREPRNGAERVSQALIGESLHILQEQAGWCWIRLTRDGYMGWVHTDALEPASQQKIQDYQASFAVIVQQALLPAMLSPVGDEAKQANNQAGKLPFGVRLPVMSSLGDFTQLQLPDGRGWWVTTSGLLALPDSPKPDPAGIRLALGKIKEFIGVPYLWGGRTPYGYDCSGLAQMFLNFLGIYAPRDADQLYQAGKEIEGQAQPGDLLFFGENVKKRGQERHASITHVAISLGSDLVIHATGATWSVTYNSLNPAHHLYRPWLHDNLVGIRRLT